MAMFEFYELYTDFNSCTKEIKKVQYEETLQTAILKEMLEKEINNYEE